MKPAAPATVWQRWRAWFAVAALVGLATGLSAWFDDQISLTSQAMLFLAAVVVAASLFERLAAVVCAIAAVTALNFCFVPPRYTLAVEHREHLIALAVMLAVALLVSYLSSGLRRETTAARRSEARAEQLAALATELADATSEAAALEIGRRALEQSFEPPVIAVTAPDGGLRDIAAYEEPVVQALRCCAAEGAVLGPGTGRWPGLDAWYVPLGSRGHTIGAARIAPAAAADVVGRDHAQAICALLAQGLWRLRLAESNLAARADLQRQTLQSAFLAAVSHDLRTPLAAIVAAASALQQQRGSLGDAEQDRMLETIAGEARGLTAITENTLQMIRLADGPIALARHWESIEEIVGTVVGRLRARMPAASIDVEVEAGLPLIRADATLLAQVLANLLDNAMKYGAGHADLRARAADGRLVVSVGDRGRGIAVDDEPRLFEPFFRGAHESTERGVGLGLALSRSIAQAHGGTLAYRRRSGGGSCFALCLPVDPAQPSRPVE